MTVDWSQVDSVLLDMDGTLLDLHFDNYFWLQYVPMRYGEKHGISRDEAWQILQPMFDEGRGTLAWYCVDTWTDRLGMDVEQLKHDIADKIAIRPHSIAFLKALGQAGKQRILLTNAHHKALELKIAHTGLDDHLEHFETTHDFDAAKEQAHFWPAFSEKLNLDLSRCLFLDDTLSVLQAAKDAGVGQVVMMRQPDSTQAVRDSEGFPGIVHFDEIMPL
jgi:putative hydrolase of the HAD superfamily